MESKGCTVCGKEKPLEEFNIAKKGKYGRDSKCRECKKVESRKYFNHTGERERGRPYIKEGIKYKVCKMCENEKEITEYYLHGNTYVARCKPCYLTLRRKGTVKKIELVLIHGTPSKECRDCGVVKGLELFHKNQKGVGGKGAKCKVCQRAQWREHRKKDPEKASEQSRKWRIANPEKQAAAQRKWRLENKGKERLYNNQRKARVRDLRDDLTSGQWESILEKFDYSCALSGKKENMTMEHFIPVSSGYEGTCVGNVYPMNSTLNGSKHNRNPFEWFEEAKERHELNQGKWDQLIQYLAKANGLTIPEFKSYVNGVYEELEFVEVGGIVK